MTIEEQQEAIREGLAMMHGSHMWKDDFYGEHVTDHDREVCRKWADQVTKEILTENGAVLAHEMNSRYMTCFHYPLMEKK